MQFLWEENIELLFLEHTWGKKAKHTSSHMVCLWPHEHSIIKIVNKLWQIAKLSLDPGLEVLDSFLIDKNNKELLCWIKSKPCLIQHSISFQHQSARCPWELTNSVGSGLLSLLFVPSVWYSEVYIYIYTQICMWVGDKRFLVFYSLHFCRGTSKVM